jgi:hypothetical protein
MFLHGIDVVQMTWCCLETWRSSRRGPKGVESHMSVPDGWIGATWYCDQTSQVSQRKLPRRLRSSAEVAADSPRRFFSRERVFFGAGSLFVPCSGGGSWGGGMAS